MKTKQRNFFIYVQQVYLMKNKKIRKEKAHFKWLSSFISFFFVYLLLFCLFFGNIYKVKSSFWYYDASTSPFFVFTINRYNFILYSCIKIGCIIFDLLIIIYAKYLRLRIKANKKSPVDFLSVFIFLILGSTHYFAQ